MLNYKRFGRKAESVLEDAGHQVQSQFSGNTDFFKIAGGIIIGVAVGAIAGLLLAPKKGSETRASIKDSLKDAGANVSEKAKVAASKLADLKDTAVEKVKAKIGSTERAVGEADSEVL